MNKPNPFDREKARLDYRNVTRPATGYKIDDDGDVLIYWGGYEYWITEDRINTPEKLLDWIRHMGEKGWEGMTPQRISRLIEDLGGKYKWKIYNA